MVDPWVCCQGQAGNFPIAGDHVDRAGGDVCQQAQIRLQVTTDSSMRLRLRLLM